MDGQLDTLPRRPFLNSQCFFLQCSSLSDLADTPSTSPANCTSTPPWLPAIGPFEPQGWKGPEPVWVAWVLPPCPRAVCTPPGPRALHVWPVATSTSCPSRKPAGTLASCLLSSAKLPLISVAQGPALTTHKSWLLFLPSLWAQDSCLFRTSVSIPLYC